LDRRSRSVEESKMTDHRLFQRREDPRLTDEIEAEKRTVGQKKAAKKKAKKSANKKARKKR
jgi:hypothetical protein